MGAFARFKNEIWCMDLEYVDKLAIDNNGVKCLLVRQDLFGRIVDAKGKKTEESKETVKTISRMNTKKNRPKKIWVYQGTEIAGNIFIRNTEDYGYKYINKLPQFIATMNSRNNRSIDMKHNHVRNSDFMSILYSKTLRENKKPKFGIGGRDRISKYDLLFRKGYKPQNTQETFEIVSIATKKPPTYTINEKQEEVKRGKFYEKGLITVN